MATQWHAYKPSGDWVRPRHVTSDISMDTTTLSLFMIHDNHWHERIKTYLKQALVLSLFLLVLEPKKQGKLLQFYFMV